MKRRRRSEEEDSSLELLLDTMCNTFGGVMFIAISIFVIISGMTQIENTEAQVEEIDSVALQQQLSSLTLALKELQLQMQNKSAEIASRKNIDQTDNLEKLKQLTKLIKELEAQEKALKTSQNALNKAKRRSEKLLKSVQQQDKLLQKKIEEQEKKILSLYADMNKLKNIKIESKKMVFKRIESSTRAPYFIILDNDKAYPVGPDLSSRYHPASLTKEITYQDGQPGTECCINPGKGITVMSGNRLSREFKQFLDSLPYTRAPMFFISPNTAPTVQKMREVLKKDNMLHGMIFSGKDGTPLYLVSSTTQEYEY